MANYIQPLRPLHLGIVKAGQRRSFTLPANAVSVHYDGSTDYYRLRRADDWSKFKDFAATNYSGDNDFADYHELATDDFLDKCGIIVSQCGFDN